MESNKNTDNWSSLLSQLGVDAPNEEHPVAPLVSEPTAEPEIVELAVVEPEPRLDDPVSEPPIVETSAIEESKRNSEGKRTFFDRFPKINLFGTPPKDPLDAVVAGTKPTMKPAETFTSKKLEKVEPPPSRHPRREPEAAAPPTAPPAPVSKGCDPWSMIASQVGNLTVPEADEVKVDTTPEPVTPEPVTELPWKKPKTEAPQRGRRTPPSMFDDAPVAGSKESTTVRSILDAEEPKPFADAAERLSTIFNDNTDPRPTKPGPRREAPVPRRDEPDSRRDEYGSRRHVPDTEKRGRGTRRNEPTNEVPMWDIEEESKPVERSGRRRSRHSERSERDTVQPSRFRERQTQSVDAAEDAGFATPNDVELHRGIPSWDDAISAIIEANIAKHAKRSPDQCRGRGVRR